MGSALSRVSLLLLQILLSQPTFMNTPGVICWSGACPILLILAERQSFRCRACGRWLPRCLQHQCPRSLWYHLCCCQTTSTREGAPYSIPTRLVRLSIRPPRTHRFQSTPHICILRIPELSLFTSTEQLKHRFSAICRFQCLRRPCR